MPRLTKEERLSRVHAEALRRFDAIQDVCADERKQCLQDRRFYSIAGAQWEGQLGEMFANKPMFEVNKVHLQVMRLISEYRNNRISVDFAPKDGSPKDDLSDACDALYRADEQDSAADEAYDNAFEEAVGGGFGAWRLRACYEDEYDPENERQRIRFEPIFDADSCVFFDPNAKRQDKSDAKFAFVITPQAPSDYEDEWGDSPASWPKDIDGTQFDWAAPDVVYVAEYYVAETESETKVTFQLITGDTEDYFLDDLEEDPTILERLTAQGAREIKRRNTKERKIRKYIMSGGKVLEDCGHIAGKCIPIVPVFGKRWIVDGIERMSGHVRTAKDAQRLKNMQVSRLGEIAALSPIQKPILTPEQVQGHQVMWSEDNVKNYPYLLINPIMDASGQTVAGGPVGMTHPPAIPPALGALLELTEQDLRDLLGSAQNGDQIVSNIGAKTVEMVQNRLDMQTFIYMSNMAKAVRRCGEIWLSMAKELYSPAEGEEIRMKGYDSQGSPMAVEMGAPIIDKRTGKVVMKNDLSKADMDVAVHVGPTSQSRRDGLVRTMTSLLPVVQDPETQTVLQAMVMMNLEGEGLSEVRDFFRKKLVNLGAMKPNDEDLAAMQAAAENAQPDPQTVYLQAAAKEAEAKAVKAMADSAKTVADTELTRAKTAETLSGLDIDRGKAAVEMAKELENAVQGANLPAQGQGVMQTMGVPPAQFGE